MAARREYTKEEDQRILDFVRGKKDKISGNQWWRLAEYLEIVPGRSYQSLRSRYLKVLRPRWLESKGRLPRRTRQPTPESTSEEEEYNWEEEGGDTPESTSEEETPESTSEEETPESTSEKEPPESASEEEDANEAEGDDEESEGDQAEEEKEGGDIGELEVEKEHAQGDEQGKGLEGDNEETDVEEICSFRLYLSESGSEDN